MDLVHARRNASQRWGARTSGRDGTKGPVAVGYDAYGMETKHILGGLRAVYRFRGAPDRGSLHGEVGHWPDPV
jgi:hypothetical protein